MLRLPVCERTTFVLSRPHYPENVGAAARAIKTMGITRLALVKPGRLAVPEHEMAFKMAVKAWDVLEEALRFDDLDAALVGHDLCFATSSRPGQSGVLTPRQAAELAQSRAEAGASIAVVFGNEKTGLSSEELLRLPHGIRIPMAAAQPSVNLAQACQIVAYEFFCAGLAAREGGRSSAG